MAVAFEDIWDYRIGEAHERRVLPTVQTAQPGDRQVLVPHPGDPHRLPGPDAPPVSLDVLADKPWVESVVAEWPCQASVPLAGLRSLFMLNTFQVGGELLVRLPNLEQLAAEDVLPEDLHQLPRLRDLSLGWHTYDIPKDYPHLELIRNPSLLQQFPVVTAGAPALAALPGLERLIVRDFKYREPADPIAELVNLRWLRLWGWRNLRVLGRLTKLERLELVEFKMTNLKPFRHLTRLRSLHLMGRLKALDGIEALTALEDVYLRGRVARDLAPLAAVPQLRELELVYPDAVEDFTPIGGLHSLRRLEILLGGDTDSGPLLSIDFLAGLDRLEELELLNVHLLDNRLDALFELPHLRFLRLTGRSGPNVDELRGRRPDVEIVTHLVGEPEGRVYVGPVHYDAPAPGIERWSIFQSLAELLGTETNDDAERRLRSELRRRDPALLKRLEFDSEAGGVGVYAESETDIRDVAEAARDLAGMRDSGDGN